MAKKSDSAYKSLECPEPERRTAATGTLISRCGDHCPTPWSLGKQYSQQHRGMYLLIPQQSQFTLPCCK